MMGRESTRDMPLSQSAGMNEDINLSDNTLKASLRRFNLRLKVWYEGNFSDYQENRRQRLGKAADVHHRVKYKRLTR